MADARLKAIRAADRRYQRTSDTAHQASQERTAAIRAAVRAGVSMADIGRELGISRARVAQIVHGNG